MLSGDVADGRLVAVSVAYLVYGPDNRLKFYNEGAAKVFPVFRERDVIGLTRDDVRDILRSQDDFRDTIDELTRRSAGGKRLTSDMGGFRFGKDGVFALDDLPLPDGTTVTVIRDLSGKKRAMDAVERLDAALTRLGQEEAIYNGTKARAYEILTEVACGALGASRTDVWLLNVDGTALYAQESYWDAGGEHRDMGRVDEAGCAPLFCAIKGLEPLTLLEPADAPELKGFDLAGYFRSVLLVPICRGPRAIGVILVAQADEARDWNASEISFVSYLCGLVMRMLEAHDRQVAEEGLRGFNEMLEKRVKDRTRELEEAMENLHLAQGELVRSEKMASLGGLVAGVAHEINTPLGVALTGITHMAEELTAFRRAVESGQIKRSDLNAFIEAVAEGTAMAERNLDRAAHLVRSFKMVAVDQTADDVRELDLAAYLGEIVESLRPTLRKTGVMVEASAEGDLHMQTVAGDISHVLTNLIMNAALHAFPEGWTREKVIKVQARRMPDRVTIEVIDNGAGIPEASRTRFLSPFSPQRATRVARALASISCSIPSTRN